MCLAGIEPADNLVAATFNPAFAWTAAVFLAETPSGRGGGAAHHGARRMVSTAVYEAWCTRPVPV